MEHPVSGIQHPVSSIEYSVASGKKPVTDKEIKMTKNCVYLSVALFILIAVSRNSFAVGIYNMVDQSTLR